MSDNTVEKLEWVVSLDNVPVDISEIEVRTFLEESGVEDSTFQINHLERKVFVRRLGTAVDMKLVMQAIEGKAFKFADQSECSREVIVMPSLVRRYFLHEAAPAPEDMDIDRAPMANTGTGKENGVPHDSIFTPSPNAVLLTLPRSFAHEVSEADVIARIDARLEGIKHTRWTFKEEDKVPLFDDLTALLQDPKQQRIVHTMKHRPEQNLIEVWQGKVFKGKEYKANCVGLLAVRGHQDPAEVQETIDLLPKEFNIEYRIPWRGTGFEHLVSPDAVVFVLSADPAERKQPVSKDPTSQSIIMGILRSLTLKQRIGLCQFTVPGKEGRFAALCIPPTPYHYDTLNIPWHVKEVVSNESILVVVGKKQLYKMPKKK